MACEKVRVQHRINIWNQKSSSFVKPFQCYCEREEVQQEKRGKLAVSILGFAPFVIKDNDGSIGGTDAEILDIVAETIGFQYEFVKETTWGRPTGNGSWSGTIGHVS